MRFKRVAILFALANLLIGVPATAAFEGPSGNGGFGWSAMIEWAKDVLGLEDGDDDETGGYVDPVG